MKICKFVKNVNLSAVFFFSIKKKDYFPQPASQEWSSGMETKTLTGIKPVLWLRGCYLLSSNFFFPFSKREPPILVRHAFISKVLYSAVFLADKLWPCDFGSNKGKQKGAFF